MIHMYSPFLITEYYWFWICQIQANRRIVDKIVEYGQDVRVWPFAPWRHYPFAYDYDLWPREGLQLICIWVIAVAQTEMTWIGHFLYNLNNESHSESIKLVWMGNIQWEKVFALAS